ncbi:hypothetical protein IPL85_00135 [Candidatus Saccharibacteria bacterium]|nr:MAG: hypothetical protein IPL85_00135 [Candidatus Saccharibacteria bacterium]
MKLKDPNTSGDTPGNALGISLQLEGRQGNLFFPDMYAHWMARPAERGSKPVIDLARRTMFEGYLETGLAKPAAESPDNFLLPHIDKSGHLKTGIIHFAARSLTDSFDTAGARLVDVADPKKMPTFGLIKSGLPPEQLLVMRKHIQSGKPLMEMGALAKSRAAHEKDKNASKDRQTTGVAEVIRKVLGYTVGKEMLLYCSMVKEAHDALTPQLSPNNLEVIGTPVVLEENPYRRQTTLLPVLIRPDAFVSNLLAAVSTAPDVKTRQRYIGGFLFFSDSLPAGHLSEEQVAARALFGSMLLSSRSRELSS